jgi:hypothetical protein
MMVASRRQYYGAERFLNLRGGERFCIDSQLGGFFTIEFSGKIEHGFLEFKIVNPGWEGFMSFRREELNTVLFDVVPDAWVAALEGPPLNA